MMDIAAARFELDDEETADEARPSGPYVAPDDAISQVLPLLADLAGEKLAVEGPAPPPASAQWISVWVGEGEEHRLALSRQLVANLVALRCGGAPSATVPPEPGAIETMIAARIAAAAGAPPPRLQRLFDLGPGWRIGTIAAPLGELWRDVRVRTPEPSAEDVAARRSAERQRLAQTPLQLCVELATVRLPLARLEALTVGSVLPLLALDRLMLTCAGRRIARAAHVEGATIRSVRIEAGL
jgi:flagellar motor switch/type III secretory pathway protein FliN